MRVAVVSDIHGNWLALEAVIDDIKKLGIDHIANLGDCLSGPLWPSETADCLIDLGWPTVGGNHDKQMLVPGIATGKTSDSFAVSRIAAHHRLWLASLPEAIELAPDFLLCHGTPQSDAAYWLHRGKLGAMRKATDVEVACYATDHPLALCGHTHIARCVTLSDGRIVANPGSVGLPTYDDDALSPDVPEPGAPLSRYLVAERSDDGTWRVKLHGVSYDNEAAARQAERNGWANWAYALRTGRVQLR